MNADKNPQKIKSMFSDISSRYDLMNNIISFGTHFIIKFLAIRELEIKPRSNVLDLCCGTGDFTKIIRKFYPRSKVIGLDFSPEMVKLAKLKNPKGTFIQGDCTGLPFGEREFDYITMSFGLRNVENRESALKEIHRVLDKGGKFLHLDFGYRNIFSSIFDMFTFFITRFTPNKEHYEYLLQSKKEFPEPDELIKEFEQQGFRCVKVCNYFFGAISAQIAEKV